MAYKPTADAVFGIPQPAGWGLFTLAYKPTAGARLESPNRQVGDRSL